jgi:hypothetical protein
VTPEERTTLLLLLDRVVLPPDQRAAFLAVIEPKRRGRPMVARDANGFSDRIRAQARIWNFYLDNDRDLAVTLDRYEATAGAATVETVCARGARAEVYACAKRMRDADPYI